MAASEESCDGNPNFAIICSFINKFGDDCGVNISIPYLQEMLEDTKNVHEDLQELLIHLLRRGRKRVNKERWEKCLIKFCHEYSSVDAWEIERFGFLKSKLSVKLELLKRLLELQFDANAKFKAEVNKHDAGSLRILPLGRDIDGQSYWYQLDKEYNMRLYRETVGEDGEWKLLCSTTEDLKTLLSSLEKKYSGPSGGASESNDPKSPSSDKPVPKKELDTEDLTSCLSETKPCTIIIKTEKKDHSDMLNCVKNDNFSVVNDISEKMEITESENNTRVKLKLKKEPHTNSKTELKSDGDALGDNSAVKKVTPPCSDPDPMLVDVIDKETVPVLSSKSVIDDIEMKEAEDLKVCKSKSEEHTDQKESAEKTDSTVDGEKLDSINHHKSSKIKLYEKWSNEKKKLDANRLNTEDCNVNLKVSSIGEEKEQCISVISNQKEKPAIPLECGSEHQDKTNILCDQNINSDVEKAVDLSTSTRVNVIVQNLCSKPSLSNGVPSKTSEVEKVESNVSSSNVNFNSNTETNEEKSSKISTDFKCSSHEAESKKFHKKNKVFSDYYSPTVINSTGSATGLSHLQALQNMCETNEMGGIPSVIQSTNYHNIDSNKNVISESKSADSSVNFENMSKKYNFNEVYCSGNKIHVDDHEATDVLLKPNVCKSEYEKNKKRQIDKLQAKKHSSEFKESVIEEKVSEKNFELQTDLSCPTNNESKNKLKSISNENVEKNDSFTTTETNSHALQNVISSDIKKTHNEESCANDKENDVSKLVSGSEKECNNVEENITNSFNLLQHSTHSEKDVDVKSAKGLKEQNNESNSKSKIDISPIKKEIFKESVNELAKDVDDRAAVGNEAGASCSSDKIKSKVSKSSSKESKTEILVDKKENSKSDNCEFQECENKQLRKLDDSTVTAPISVSSDAQSEASLAAIDSSPLDEKDKRKSSSGNELSASSKSEKNSVTNIETTASEKNTEIISDIKKDAERELMEKCNNEVTSNQVIPQVTEAPAVICENDIKSTVKTDVDETVKQESLKIADCNVNKVSTDKEMLIKGTDKDISDDCVLRKNDSKETSSKNVDIKKTYKDTKDMSAERDFEKKTDKTEESIDKDSKESVKKTEEKDNIHDREICFKEVDCKEIDERKKTPNNDKENVLLNKDSEEMSKIIEDTKEAFDSNKKSKLKESKCEEKYETTEENKKAFGSDKESELAKEDCKKKTKTCEESIKALDKNKESMLQKNNCKKMPETSEEGNNILDGSEDSELEKKDSKEKCKKNEDTLVSVGILEKNLNQENSKNTLKENADINDEDIVEENSCKKLSKKSHESDKAISNNANSMFEKNSCKEKSKVEPKKKLPGKNDDHLLGRKDFCDKSDKSSEEQVVEEELRKENKIKCVSKINSKILSKNSSNEKADMETVKEMSEDKSQDKSLKVTDDDMLGKIKGEDLEKSPNSSKNEINLSSDACEKVNVQDDNLNNKNKSDAKSDGDLTSKSLKNKSSVKPPSRNSKSYHADDKDEAECKDNLNIPDKEVDIENEQMECDESKNCSKNFYAEQMTVYYLRHSTCLEAKFKHPFCNKYVRKPVEPKTKLSKLLNEDPQSDKEVSPPKTKKCLRGKNSKQTVVQKTQPTAKTPAKKTPDPNAKKVSSRNQKKDISEKCDFAIPEGFLEILGNAEKSAEKGGKKRKGIESKEPPDSRQSSENESTPIKRSRRIQEQHQKKMTELAVEMEREQRMLEQMAKHSNSAKKNKSTPQKSPVKANVKGSNVKSNVKSTNTPLKSLKTKCRIEESETEEDTCMESRRATRKMNSRSKNLTKMTLLYEDESKDSQFSTSRETDKSKKRKRGRGQKKGYKPWDISSESSSSVEEITEEEEEEEEEPEEPLIFDVNEDEFACEEVDPNAEPVVVRRARTAKKNEVEDAAEECINDDTPCQKCGKYDKPEWILLCDKCDSGYHTHCLIPPLMLVPDGDWFCQPCEHMSLCQCLHEELNKLEVILKQKEREELRKQRLAYVGISLDNVLKPEKKEKSDESSKDDDEDEDEDEEAQKEQENRRPQKSKQSFEDERHEKLYGKRSVRARRNVNYQFKEYDELIFSALQEDMVEVPEEFKEEGSEAGSEAGSDKPFTAKISTRKKRGRRWKDFDYSDDEDSGEEYQGGSTDSEATPPPSSHSDQESGSGEWKVVKSKKKSQRKARSRRRRGGDSSEEDWEDEVIDNDTYRPTTRRAAQKAISYREISSEEDEWGAAKSRGTQKRRKASSSESEASFDKKRSKKKRIRKWASSDSSEESEEKSMSSSGSEEEEDSQAEESENDRKEKMRLKASTNKKVLSSDDEESSTQDSAPKSKAKKVISDESEEDEEEEDEEDEEEEEESESEENSDENDEEKEKSEKKNVIPEKKVSPTVETSSTSKPDAEKKELSTEKVENAPDNKVVSIDKETSLSITENKEFQPKVLVKKELCNVDVPLEPVKQPVTVSAVSEKALPKIVRKETTKMVPCVIPYEKSPKSGHTSNPEEENDKERSKEEVFPQPVPFPNQGVPSVPPPTRLQFSGRLAYSVPSMTSPVRPHLPPTNLPPHFTPPTNLPARLPLPSSVVVRHHAPANRLPARPVSNIPIPPATAPSSQNPQSKSEKKLYKSTIMEPFDENESDEEVPLERIPAACPPAPLPNRPIPYEKETEYRPAAKELSSYSYAPPEEKPFPGSYTSLGSFQDFSARPSPLKPSLVETYPNNSSPSKLTPLDNYSQTSSPKGFISLDSYSENRKKKHFYGNSQETEQSHRPAPPPSENYQGGEIRFPPEPYPCPQSPNTYSHRSPPPNQRDSGTPPRLYSQFPDAYAPPRSPEYYQNHQYYASEERIPRPSYQPNYAPQEPSFVTNPYVATPVPQPNGGFMIDTLLRARNHEEGEDELTGVTDIVSYITQE